MVSTNSDDVPTRAAASRESPAANVPLCGPVPSSSGPLTGGVELTLDAPASMPAGESVSVLVTITSTAAVPRMITVPALSALLVVRDGQVVGGARGESTTAVPLQLNSGEARPAQAIPNAVRLVGCASDTAPLAAGTYTLVAVLGYRIDSLNAAPNDSTVVPPATGRDFALVSAPVLITVT